MQEKIKKHDRDIRLSRTQTSAISEHAHEIGHYRFGVRSCLLIEILNGTHVGLRKLST